MNPQQLSWTEASTTAWGSGLRRRRAWWACANALGLEIKGDRQNPRPDSPQAPCLGPSLLGLSHGAWSLGLEASLRIPGVLTAQGTAAGLGREWGGGQRGLEVGVAVRKINADWIVLINSLKTPPAPEGC